MAKRFNEVHQYVINNWIEARKLEDSMIDVREKYERVFERVIKAVQEEKPEFNNCQLHLKESAICFAKKKWSRKSEKWPPGLWIWPISLDKLMADDLDGTWPQIWFCDPKGKEFDLKELEEARIKIKNASVELLKGEKPKYSFDDESDRSTLLWYNIPESRQELVQMLLDHESEKFVKCLASNVMILARFIPVLDEILLTKSP